MASLFGLLLPGQQNHWHMSPGSRASKAGRMKLQACIVSNHPLIRGAFLMDRLFPSLTFDKVACLCRTELLGTQNGTQTMCWIGVTPSSLTICRVNTLIRRCTKLRPLRIGHVTDPSKRPCDSSH